MLSEIARLQSLLRYAYGCLAIIVGLDKFLNLLVDWQQYISPYILETGINAPALMHVVGTTEVAVGFLIFSRWAKSGAYALAFWLAFIAVDLLTSGEYYDIAVYNIALAAGAYVFARLTELRRTVDANAAS